MRNRRTRLFVAAWLVAGLPGLAAANPWTATDQDDLDRPLSIASVTAGHITDEALQVDPTVTVTFDQPLLPEEMGPNDFVVVVVESDGEAPNDEWIYLIAVDGQLQRVSYNPHSDQFHEISDSMWSRPTPESVEIQVSKHYPGDSHAFAAASYTESAPGCAEGCWDWAPNHGALIHDWTAPWVRGVREPSQWTYQRTLMFYWEASDAGLSGFKRSTLMRSEPGSGKWRPVSTQDEPGRYKILVRPLNQGSNVMLRPVAQDRAGNKTLGPTRRTRVPWDQGNTNGPRRFAGKWQEEMSHGFGGTVHVSKEPAASLTFPGTGNLYCFHGWWGPDPVRATFEVGGQTIEIDTVSSPPTYNDGYPKCIDLGTVEERTATLTVHEGPLTVDWYWAGIYASEFEPVTEEREATHPHPAPGIDWPKARIKAGSELARAALSQY